MTERDKAIAFNKETKAALELVFKELNHGQQQKLMKNEKVKQLLERYAIGESE